VLGRPITIDLIKETYEDFKQYGEVAVVGSSAIKLLGIDTIAKDIDLTMPEPPKDAKYVNSAVFGRVKVDVYKLKGIDIVVSRPLWEHIERYGYFAQGVRIAHPTLLILHKLHKLLIYHSLPEGNYLKHYIPKSVMDTLALYYYYGLNHRIAKSYIEATRLDIVLGVLNEEWDNETFLIGVGMMPYLVQFVDKDERIPLWGDLAEQIVTIVGKVIEELGEP